MKKIWRELGGGYLGKDLQAGATASAKVLWWDLVWDIHSKASISAAQWLRAEGWNMKSERL